MRIRISFSIILYLFIHSIIQGQSKEIQAQSAVLNAESSYENAEYNEALEYLNEAEKVLGKTNSRIQYLKVKSNIALGLVDGYDKETLIKADQELKKFFEVTNENTYSAEKYDEMVKELAHIRKLIKDAEIEEQRIKSDRADFNRNDEAAYNSARHMNTIEAYNLYIKNYPGGKHVKEASHQVKLAEIKEQSAGKMKEYDNNIKKNPKVAKNYEERGKLKMDYEDFKGAAQDFTYALELKTDKSELAIIYYNRGTSRLNLNDYQGAIDDYSKIIQMKPDVADVYLKRGFCYFALKDFDNATKDLNKSLELKPTEAAYYYKGLVNYNSFNHEAAISDFTKAININPTEKSYRLRGYCELRTSDYQNAINDLTNAISMNQNNPAYFYYRGKTYEKSGNKAAARSDFERTIELNSDTIFTAFAYFDLGNMTEAMSLLDKMILVNNNNSEKQRDIFYNQACLYSLAGRKSDAIRALNNAFEKGYNNFIWLDHDDNFDNIRNSPEFTELVNKYKNEKK